MKIKFKFLLTIFVVSISFLSWINQAATIKDINLEIESKKDEIREIEEKNKLLSAQLSMTSNNQHIEKIARERLGLIKSGEKIIKRPN